MIKKVIKWVAITLAAAVLLPVLLLVAINLFDEDLDPKAAAYGEPRAASVPATENAYFALIALNASDGADSMAYARAWQGEVKAAAVEKRKEKLPDSKRAKRPALCEPRDAPCLSQWREKSDEIAQQLEAYKEDLARYDTLIGYKRYEEILDYAPRADSTMAPYLQVASAQRAYLLRTAMDAEAGRLEEAVAALVKDFAFQRMLLGSSRTLIGKMVAIANFWRDMQFVNELMQVRTSEITPFLPQLRQALGALEPGKLKLGSTMETEFQLPKAAFQDLREGLVSQGLISGMVEGGSASGKMWDVVGLFFFKRNASLNRSFRYYSGMGGVMDAPADKLDEQQFAFKAAQPPVGPQWNWVYNPVGKILVDVAAPSFQEYAWRVHDLDALSRLLALRIDILTAGVSAEQAAEFIAKSDASLHNPYTRKPMNWDADKKRIYFEPSSASTKRYKQGVDNGRVFIAL
jgi:hypothetical protein